MIGNNIAGTLSQIGLRSVQPATVIDNGKDMGKAIQDSLKMYNDYSKKQAYIDALQGGNQEKIDSALASYNPEAYAQVMQAREQRANQLADADTQFARQKELAQMNFGNQLALENVRNQNAIGLKKLALDLKNQTDEQAKADSLDLAQQGINQLAQVGKDNNIGVFTNWRREHGLTGKDVENDLGKISSGVAAIAPKAISKLKAAGVSGINSLPEFMTYIGLPQNPTSKQILGAIPMMAQIAGVKNPLEGGQANPADIVTSMPTGTEMQVGSTQKFNNGFSITRVK